MCRRTIKITYTEFAPYIFNNETGHASGLFPGNNFLKPYRKPYNVMFCGAL